MECVEAALKTSFRTEMAIKLSPQAFSDDFYTFNMQNVTSSDDFIVDELFDFSNEEQELAVVEEEDDEEEEEEEEEDNDEHQPKPNTAVSEEQQPPEDDKISLNISNFATEISVPAEDLASLEWLSHFVEDSNSEYSAPFPAGMSHAKPQESDTTTTTTTNSNLSSYAPEKQVLTEALFKIPIPAKARSKRSRTGVRVWPIASPCLTESSSSSTSSSSSFTSSSSSSPFTTEGLNCEPNEPVCFEKLLVNKPKKRLSGQVGSSGGGSHPPRRCSHCGVQKTPQWRTGPLGAKTLCNACGVRFKSGRLLPEYRPACSPTFSSELHSNHHRKVLEMRKKKELS